MLATSSSPVQPHGETHLRLLWLHDKGWPCCEQKSWTLHVLMGKWWLNLYSIHTSLFIHIYICICIYINICVYVYIYMCIYMYIYMCVYVIKILVFFKLGAMFTKIITHELSGALSQNKRKQHVSNSLEIFGWYELGKPDAKGYEYVSVVGINTRMSM